MVTPEKCRAFGRDIALALRTLLYCTSNRVEFRAHKVADVDTVDEKSGKTIPASKLSMDTKID